MADQPTPAGSATPRDVIVDTLAFLGLPENVGIPNSAVAETIIAALAAAGYHVLTSEQLLMACSLHFMPRAETTIAKEDSVDDQ